MEFKGILGNIGNTPLAKVDLVQNSTILAKLEYLNPGGSVKDRSALFMIEEAERKGFLQPGGTIIDASSGNHGIAVAMIGRIKGYKTIITVSKKISLEKLKTIQAYGAEVVVCDPTDFIEDPKSYHSVAVEIQKNTPNSFMPNQYFNVWNAEAHYRSLGPEIWRQTEGKITHFFAGAGTCGTISGTGKFLKEQNPNIKVIAIDSNTSFRATNGNPKPYQVEGMGMDFETPVLIKEVLDDIIEVTDQDAIAMLKKLANQKGLLVGPSSGAVLHAAQTYLKNIKGALAVGICGDSGRAYLSKNFYTEISDNQAQIIKKEETAKLNI
ncbi:MAG: Cystathionine beta-synthase [candidate division TM6 bacterium GW2011_GWF2_32_72]|nr:MAG: Cystathionine beta-synthase [candidate division TM6 bacterium GW2011_GWF2_32_72]